MATTRAFLAFFYSLSARAVSYSRRSFSSAALLVSSSRRYFSVSASFSYSFRSFSAFSRSSSSLFVLASIALSLLSCNFASISSKSFWVSSTDRDSYRRMSTISLLYYTNEAVSCSPRIVMTSSCCISACMVRIRSLCSRQFKHVHLRISLVSYYAFSYACLTIFETVSRVLSQPFPKSKASVKKKGISLFFDAGKWLWITFMMLFLLLSSVMF